LIDHPADRHGRGARRAPGGARHDGGRCGQGAHRRRRAVTARGRALFEDEGCDRCHAIAATGAEGMLGPRLDVIDDGDG